MHSRAKIAQFRPAAKHFPAGRRENQSKILQEQTEVTEIGKASLDSSGAEHRHKASATVEFWVPRQRVSVHSVSSC
jgi:hypothetical protein